MQERAILRKIVGETGCYSGRMMLVALLYLTLTARADDPDAPPPAVAGAAAVKPGPATAVVTSVYDGDTFTLDTGDRVRLRWVNTPELKPAEDYGIEAKTLATTLL